MLLLSQLTFIAIIMFKYDLVRFLRIRLQYVLCQLYASIVMCPIEATHTWRQQLHIHILELNPSK